MNNIRFIFECNDEGYMSSFDEGTIQMEDSSSGIGVVSFLGTHNGWTMRMTIQKGIREGDIVKVEITASDTHDLQGELCSNLQKPIPFSKTH